MSRKTLKEYFMIPYQQSSIALKKKAEIIVDLLGYILVVGIFLLIRDIFFLEPDSFFIVGDIVFIGYFILGLYYIRRKIEFSSHAIDGMYWLVFIRKVVYFFHHSEIEVEYSDIYLLISYLIVTSFLYNFLSINHQSNLKMVAINNSIYILLMAHLFLQNSLIWNDLIQIIILGGAVNIGIFVSFKQFSFTELLIDQIQREEREKTDALTHVIEGFVPICAHCKSIRNEDGSWTQIEAFIGEKSDKVQFSHGLCDECVKKHYDL